MCISIDLRMHTEGKLHMTQLCIFRLYLSVFDFFYALFKPLGYCLPKGIQLYTSTKYMELKYKLSLSTHKTSYIYVKLYDLLVAVTTH